jgi:hypothetical protein
MLIVTLYFKVVSLLQSLTLLSYGQVSQAKLVFEVVNSGQQFELFVGAVDDLALETLDLLDVLVVACLFF